MKPAITIACVRQGTAYPAEYVEILFDMLSRCMPEEMPFRQVCLTDQPDTYENVLNLPIPDGLDGWWAKLALFRPGAFEPGERVLYFDLDTLLVGMLTDIAGYKGDFAALRDAYRPDGLQSAVMAWEAGKCDFIWHLWVERGYPEIKGGDQAFIEYALDCRYGELKFDRLQDVFPKQIVSFKADCLNGPPASARVVFFHGDPKPSDFESGWVKDFWRIGGLAPVDLKLVCNTAPEDTARNVKSALKRGLPEFPYSVEPHGGTVCIIGGGPSVRNAIEELKIRRQNGQHIWALNGSASWLIANGIVPDAHWLLDARPVNAEFVREPHPQTAYYAASQCDPSVFDRLSGYNVTLFHTEANREHVPRDYTLIGGGSTVGLKAMAGAYMLGYDTIHLFGFDSSYTEDMHHAYDQALNDGEPLLTAQVGDEKFTSSAWMLNQALDFQRVSEYLVDLGLTVIAHGTGLLPSIAAKLEVGTTAATKRANAILERLPSGPVRGAEIGVFSGALSERLLRWRNDLSLIMVDSWEANGAAYMPGASDFHARLTQEQQDSFCFYAGKCTGFAESRRHIIRARSVDAAGDVPDASLDFVFIDADHSYEAVREDISVWRPKLKPGGLLCGHDYDNPDFPEWGVKRAADEFAAAHGLALETGDNFTWFIRLSQRKEAAA